MPSLDAGVAVPDCVSCPLMTVGVSFGTNPPLEDPGVSLSALFSPSTFSILLFIDS